MSTQHTFSAIEAHEAIGFAIASGELYDLADPSMTSLRNAAHNGVSMTLDGATDETDDDVYRWSYALNERGQALYEAVLDELVHRYHAAPFGEPRTPRPWRRSRGLFTNQPEV